MCHMCGVVWLSGNSVLTGVSVGSSPSSAATEDMMLSNVGRGAVLGMGGGAGTPKLPPMGVIRASYAAEAAAMGARSPLPCERNGESRSGLSGEPRAAAAGDATGTHPPLLPPLSVPVHTPRAPVDAADNPANALGPPPTALPGGVVSTSQGQLSSAGDAAREATRG